MKHILIILLIISLVYIGSAAGDGDVLSGQQYEQNQILIKIDTSVTNITTIIPSEDILYDYSDLVPGLYLIRISSDWAILEAVQYYENLTGVMYAEPDYAVSIDQSQTPTPTETSARSTFPIIGVLIGCGTVFLMYRKT